MAFTFERLKTRMPWPRDLVVAFAVAALLVLALAIRGSGWDGDSIVNIAQFEKLIHPGLFGTPDSGTLPKLLPIALYGGFHWLTGSYSIHWITIALSAYAIAALVRLPAENGGGVMWLALPFVSALWINTILAADNPALAIAFLIPGFVSLMEGKPNRAIIFFLFVEFSRPGGSFLILAMVLVAWTPFFLRACGRLNPTAAIAALVLGVAHTAFCYRLAYNDYADFTAQVINYPGSPSFYGPNSVRYDPTIFSQFAKFGIFSFPKDVLPLWATLLGVLGWAIHFRRELFARNFLWLAFLCPISILPVSAFLQGLSGFQFRTMVSIHPEYLLSAAIPVLAGLVLVFRKLWVPKWFSQYAVFFWCAVALGLAVHDGNILRGDFDTNPPESTNPMRWLSDSRVKTLVQNARKRSDRPLVLLTSCDLVPLIIDLSSYVGTFLMFSDASVDNKSDRHFKDCTKTPYKKRSEDVLLSEVPNPVAAIKPDIIYTTKDKVGGLDSTARFDSYPLAGGRILFVEKLLGVPD